MKSLFTQQDCKFLIENYPSKGLDYCATQLNIPIKKVKCKIGKLRTKFHFKLNRNLLCNRIRETRKPKDINKYLVDPRKFTHITDKEVAYLLGLIWADGTIYSNKYNNKIAVEMMANDLESLIPIFETTGKWSYNYRQRKNRKLQLRISTNNKILVDFLLCCGYAPNTKYSAEKIISNIPSNLQPYWFRGLVDGDGCFYINKKNKCYQFNIASTYDQDWRYMEILFNSLNIKYSISKRNQHQNGNLNKHSCIRISNKPDIIKFGNYIYNGFIVDNIGLFRKYKKFKDINDVQPI